MKSLERRVSDFSQAVRQFVRQFQRVHAAFANGPHAELSQQEIRLIEHLLLAGSQKMKSISEYLGVAVNSVTSIIDNMERKGYVARQRSGDDRRVIHVQLTAQGAEVAEASMQVKRKLLRSLLEVLPEDEQETLVRLFRKIAGSSKSPLNEPLEIG